MDVSIGARPYTDADSAWVEEVAGPVGGTRAVGRGVVHDYTDYPGFIAESEGAPCGFAFYRLDGAEAELVAIAATWQWRGVGTSLLAEVESAVRDAGCTRLWLITTNDNIDALRFYQRRGYNIAAVHRGAVAAARKLKPSIPEIGNYGIPIHDEIELEKQVL